LPDAFAMSRYPKKVGFLSQTAATKGTNSCDNHVENTPSDLP